MAGNRFIKNGELSVKLLLPLLSIFGGCCSNVYTLEQIIAGTPHNMGNIVTFTQILFVALKTLPEFLNFRNPPTFLRRRSIPFKIHLLSVLLFLLGTISNNSVFAFGVSVPLHIVFRSSATAITMALSWAIGQRTYTQRQVFSAILMTVGGIITIIYRSSEFSLESLKAVSASSIKTGDGVGLLLLVSSSVLLCSYSLLNDWTYRTYGKHWKESLFYMHLLSIPLLLVNWRQLKKELGYLIHDAKTVSIPLINTRVPSAAIMMAANVVTQSICIEGVSALASITDALIVSVILLLRKLTSLLLSVYLFDNRLSWTALIGTFTVFVGALMYILSAVPANEISQSSKGNKAL
ncbi:LAQU0S04e04478g1_1 [Lachancea quebecensis]|uniref:LAQU0S04e04478g1_1 n=1 Tax=Lachancea quebecensis TaxID=1654605 RepID=A0A0P1KQ63_9SACH|nr:LAQU0S04e04478g1_1 [Lachancea quebecensis]